MGAGQYFYHANNRGTLLASLVIYSSIYSDDTSDIDLSSVLSGLALTPADGVFLTSIADGVNPPGLSSDVTLKFDFGTQSNPDPNYNIVPWNGQSIANAVDYNTGQGSNISLSITSASGFNEAGPNTSGTTTPGTPASDFFDGNATTNNLFGHDSNFNVGAPRSLVEYTISGLDQNQVYDFTFFASRLGAGDNRETQYSLLGDNAGTDVLNPSGNDDDIAQILDIQPDSNGEILLTIQKGPNNVNGDGFFYLGAMDITSSGATGDFDNDFDIDGADFLAWQRGFGISSNATLSQGDGNGNGAVNATDLAIWESQYGTVNSSIGASSATTQVPEPTSCVMFFAALMAILPMRQAQRRSVCGR